MTSLYAFSDVVVALVGLALVLVGTEIGWQLGIRAKGRGANNISIVEQCLFGLLALLVGFTFSMALTRFDAQREGATNDANAIGTTALRARLLPEPHRAETLKLLREYVHLRVELIQSSRTALQAPHIVQRANEIQEALWQQAETVAAKDNRVLPAFLFIQALNEMIDIQGKRLVEVRNEIPKIVLLTLFGVTAITGAVAGYAGGVEEQRTRWPAYIMGVLICAIILVILDVAGYTGGFIRVDRQALIDTAASIAAFPD